MDDPWRGLNLIGHLEAELGIGEIARQLAGACDAAGVPILPVSVPALASRQGHHFPHAKPPIAAYANTLVCLNADQLPNAISQLGPRHLARRRTIGMWWWEVPQFPPWLAESASLVDELWAGSTWLTEILAGAVDVPVHTMPIPVAEPASAPPRSRRELGLPEGFLFLFLFDHNSVLARKNPVGLIEAYQRAFPAPDQGTTLVIKSINAHRHPEDRDLLAAAAAGRGDVHVIDRYLPSELKDAWLASCDCYVSLHRSEGFGYTIAEAMLRGKPVIVTGWSGNADFTRNDTAFVVGHALVEVGDGNHPYPADATWAQPDLDEAAGHMRAVVGDRDRARALAASGRDFVRRHFAPAAVGELIAHRLESGAMRDASPEPAVRPAAAALAAELKRLRAERRASSPPRPVASIADVCDPTDANEVGRALDQTRAELDSCFAQLVTAESQLVDAERRAG
ncbi:MAG: glycosyltransferase, partial [Chthonomonadaceae bacterium]|nr:glycosyltransferase [Chthonomonadaceae bacterium]